MDNKSIRKHPIRALMFGYLTLRIHSKRTLLMLLVLLAMAYITTYSYDTQVETQIFCAFVSQGKLNWAMK